MGVIRILNKLIELLRSKNPNFKIDIIEDTNFFKFENNSIAVILSNEKYGVERDSLEVKFYYSITRIEKENSLLDFKSEIVKFLETIETVEDNNFFQIGKVINYDDFSIVTKNSGLRTACISMTYDITKVLNVDYYEGEEKREFMNDLNLNF
ncbi:MAG: hypothetical protein ACRCXY_07630 [Fusobacteriaceae bacterium]